MKLTEKLFKVWTDDIYILPTIRIYIDSPIYRNHNISIEFHWIVFHTLLLFEERRYAG